MRRLIPLAVALALALGTASIGTADALPRVSGRTDLTAYRGLGTWVDVFDYVPAFQKAGAPARRERNAALVDPSKRVRKLAGDRPVGAIVLEPLFLDVVSPDYWPEFPWRQLSSLYDVWLPTLYWTNRSTDSGYKEGFKYTDENIRQVRSNLGEKNAPVHAIGGIADAALLKDYAGFVRARRREEDVVARDEIVGREHAAEVVAGVGGGATLVLVAGPEPTVDGAAQRLQGTRGDHAFGRAADAEQDVGAALRPRRRDGP